MRLTVFASYCLHCCIRCDVEVSHEDEVLQVETVNSGCIQGLLQRRNLTLFRLYLKHISLEFLERLGSVQGVNTREYKRGDGGE